MRGSVSEVSTMLWGEGLAGDADVRVLCIDAF